MRWIVSDACLVLGFVLKIATLTRKQRPKPTYHIFVCGQTRPEGHPRGSCGASGAGSVFQAFAEKLTALNMFDKAALTQASCFGPCHMGANVLVYPEGIMYSSVKPEDVEVIVQEHFISGNPVTEKFAPAEAWS